MMRFVIALLITGTGLSAPVGSIVGQVVDAGTREPLAGASVVIGGLDLGAAADADGRFVINRVPAGTWLVEASMVGYRTQAKGPIVVSPGHATEVEFRLSLEPTRLAEVLVRPDHFPKVKDAAVSERNFAAEEIRVAPGGNGDIQRVVQAMPSVVSSGDQDNEVIVRGGNPNENLFLVDGIEIPYPNHFGSFTTQGGPINMLNGLLVREVDFVAGAFPARYGGRTSSVMDISLKRGSTRGFDGNIDMGMAGLGAVFEFPLPGKENSFIGSYHKSFLEIMAASGVWGMSAVPYYDNLLAKATLRLADGQELVLLGLAGWDKIVLKAGEDVVKYSYSAKYQTVRTAAGLALQSLFGKTGYGRLLLSGTSAEWNGIATRDSLWLDTIQVNSTGESGYGCRYDLSLRLVEGQETEVGIGASRASSDFEFYITPDTVFRYRYSPDSVVLDSSPLLDSLGRPYVAEIDCSSRARSWKTGAYLQHRLGLGAFGVLTLGVRADQFGYTGEWTVSPRVGFSTNLLPAGIGLNVGWGVHYQEPQWYMLLQDSLANRHLRSRRSDHYVLGLERLIGDDARVSLEVYHKQNSRLPLPAHLATPDPYDYSNAYFDSARGRARGVELFVQKKHSHNWHGSLAYSLSQSMLAHPQEPESLLPAEYDYRHVLTASGTWEVEFWRQRWYQNLPSWFRSTIGGFLFSDVAGFGVRLRYMGGRPYTPREWNPETRRWLIDYSRYNSERYPDYLRLDIRWDHKFLLRGWSLSWYLEIQNLLNRRNVWQYVWLDRDPNPQTVYQFGFWPIAGMVIEF